ncbi:MAG: hypothetical protein WC998_06710 [Candidatus Paceibacterota bacterium]
MKKNTETLVFLILSFYLCRNYWSMMGLDEKNRQRTKDVLTIQSRIDSDPEYRKSFIEARKIALKRVNETGYASHIDDFLCDSFFMTLTPEDRSIFFEVYGKPMSMLDFFKTV